MIGMRVKFKNYKEYSVAGMDQLFTPEELKGSIKLKANMMQSAFVRNEGNGKFSIVPFRGRPRPAWYKLCRLKTITATGISM